MSSQDPLLATYSYISPNLNGYLLGPFCVDCMNRNYSSDSFHFHSDVSKEHTLPIFLHTKDGGKQYMINELVYLNGSEKPFHFRQLPNGVELFSFECMSEMCREARDSLPPPTEQMDQSCSEEVHVSSVATLPVTSVVSDDIEVTDRVLSDPSVATVTPCSMEPLSATISKSEMKDSGDSLTDMKRNINPVSALPEVSSAQPLQPSAFAVSTDYSHFPFLNGFRKEECDPNDVICGAKLTEFAEKKRGQLKNSTSNIDKLFESEMTGTFPQTCVVCDKQLKSAGNCLQHTLSKGHLAKVLGSGLVFSRSKDCDVAIRMLEPARQLRREKLEEITPRNIGILHNRTIVYKTSHQSKQVHKMLLRNTSDSRMAFSIDSSNIRPLSVSPCQGILDSKKNIRVVVTCDPLVDPNNSVNTDHITIKWIRISEEAGAKFSEQWFSAGSAVKDIPVQYVEGLLTVSRQYPGRVSVPKKNELSVAEISDEDFPMLKGYSKDDCLGAALEGEVIGRLIMWRPLLHELSTSITQIMKGISDSSSLDCSLCSFKGTSAGNAFRHCISHPHIKAVYAADMVFSRYKDICVAVKVLREAADIQGIPYPRRKPPVRVLAAGQNDSAERVAGEPQMSVTVLSVNNTDTAGLVDGSLDSKGSDDCREDQTKPVLEVPPNLRPSEVVTNKDVHTILRGTTVDQFPLLRPCVSDRYETGWTGSDVLTRDEVRRVWSNFQMFAPALNKLCRSSLCVCPGFVRKSSPNCGFCGGTFSCVCKMVTHFFSSEHCDEILRSGDPIFRCDVLKWTEVVDAFMNNASMVNQATWRSMNCWWGMVPSPSEPASAEDALDSAEEACEGERVDSSKCTIC